MVIDKGFINSKDIFTPIDCAYSEWTDEQIQEIAGIVRQYREEPSVAKAIAGKKGKEEYKDIKGRCKVATLKEIQANDYSLNPGRYVEIVEKEISNVDFNARMKELMGGFINLTSEAHKLEKKIAEDWKKIL